MYLFVIATWETKQSLIKTYSLSSHCMHDENKSLSSQSAWSKQMRSNKLIGSIYWKAFEYEYKWSYPLKTISESTHKLLVKYHRLKVKPCHDEQTIVKGAYKNQLNRVPIKLQLQTQLKANPCFTAMKLKCSPLPD